MLGLILIVAFLCEAWRTPVDTLNATDIQNDEGYSSNIGQPHLVKTSETLLDLEGDYAVNEGDIIIPTDRNAVSSLWAEQNGNVSVPYEIDFVIENRTEDILDALNMISEKTCIRFHPHNNETDYLHFIYADGCASYVGCRGGEQPLLTGPKCTVGNICHEIFHSLGFYHEHSRYDRGDHITVLDENIVSGKEGNFLKKKGNTLGLKYDLDSILHYGSNYFSRNGQPTIQPKESNITIGQRTHLSDLDVQRIRKLYHCDETKSGSS
ncbi:astacin-like metalloendopeptidase isoform X1 [Carassius gibelio]|uniref:astacin-like metalloendopeptidase isoform X1 n=2 Tax=Carassius gibelio TaxID=101364 RepID=UPI002278B84C|nr:astacin-like metalloendopeptidase isoform X1 [Carassius gibelio]